MWDNPRLLNGVSGFLVGIALLAATLVCLNMLGRSTLLPLREVELRSVPQQASREAIAEVMAQQGRGTFFGAPIDQLRAALEQLPWVRRAAVRRVWPDRLEVTLEEHVPLGRWGTEALVNMQGERFSGSTKGAELPVFIGPEGSESAVARAYRRFSGLVAPLGSPLERVVLTPRHAWQLKLANGMQLTLGRDTDLAEQRLARFVEAYVSSGAPAAVVDLRYPGGFAVKTRG
jgi:cell division protein FtsQ